MLRDRDEWMGLNGKEDVLIELLNKCTDRERKIAEEILKLLVTYIK